jgi:hypothetical protein
MKNHADEAGVDTRLGGPIDGASAHGATNGSAITPDDARRGSSNIKAEAVVDTWIDDHQWLAGFPNVWGERRNTWACGF